MKTHLLYSFAAAAMVAGVTVSGDGFQSLQPGSKLPDLTLRAAAGGEESLRVASAPVATVVAFTSAKCPVATVLAPRLAEMESKYSAAGVRFIFINPNAGESDADIIQFASGCAIKGPVLRDPGHAATTAFSVSRTTEIFVFDQKYILQYRGAVDDQYAPGARKPQARRSYLTEAIDAVLRGRTPSVRETQPQGCLIGREAAASRSAAPPISYYKDIAPILGKHCTDCHAPMEVGPMPLLQYSDVADVSRMIGEVVAEGRMPPWHADPRYGAWSNERRLSDAERSTLLSWVKAGAPEGEKPMNYKDPAPPPADRPWHIGTPDLILKIPRNAIPAQGTIDYRYITIATGVTEDQYVAAAEVRAGARQNVHHCLVFCKYPKARKGEQPPIDGGLEGGFFASLVPGEMPNVFPPNAGKLLPAGAQLIFQMHYTATGVAAEDITEIGLKFHKMKPEKTVVTRGITQRRLKIAPGDAQATYEASWTVPQNIQILALSPHMHFRGKSFRYDVQCGGTTKTILSVPRFDFNWQAVYRPAKPLSVARGSVIRCEGAYDNSAANPNNPDPTATVRWGDQSWDEMFIGYIDYIED